MTNVFRVHSQKEDGFVVIIDEAGKHNHHYGITEFTVLDVLRSAGVNVEWKPSISLTKYKKQYKA